MSEIKSLKAGTQVLDRDHCPVAFVVVDTVPEVPKGKTIQAEIYKVGPAHRHREPGRSPQLPHLVRLHRRRDR